MSESINIAGLVINKGEVETFASGFCKQTIVIEVADGNYSQELPVEFMKEGIAKLEPVNVGDEVVAAINLRGREYNGKWFVNLTGWKIDVTAQAGQEPATVGSMADVAGAVADAKKPAEFDSEIPF